MTYELNKELIKKNSKEIEKTLLLMIFADSIDGVAIEDDNGEDQHLTQEDLKPQKYLKILEKEVIKCYLLE